MFLFDFNLNFGDIINEGEQSSYWFTIGVPAIIAVGSIILTVLSLRYYDNYKRDEDLDALYKHFKLQLKVFNDGLQKHNEKLKAMGDKLAEGMIEEITYSPHTDFDVKVISGWLSQDFYHSIVSRRSKEHTAELEKQFVLIKSGLNNYKNNERVFDKALNHFLDKYGREQAIYSENLTDYQNMIDRFLNVANNIPIEIKREFNDVFQVWAKEGGNRNKSETFKKIVEPSIKLCVKYKQLDLYNMRLALLRCRDGYMELIYVKKVYSETFYNVVKVYDTNKERIENAMKEIEKYPLLTSYHLKKIGNIN